MVSFTPRPIYLQGKVPGTHWVGAKTGLDGVEKRKVLFLPDSNSNFSAVQPVASRCIYCAMSFSSNTGIMVLNLSRGSSVGLHVSFSVFVLPCVRKDFETG
jgi:hypothetical protein